MVPNPTSRTTTRGIGAAPSTWPERRALCVDCRTALPAGRPCPAGPSHRVHSLADRAGRDAVLTEVWGPRPIRRRIAEAARAGAVTGGGTTLLEGCTGLADLVSVEGLLWAAGLAAMLAAIAFVVWLAVSLARAVIRAWRRWPPHPRGARRRPARTGPATGRIGRIVATAGERGDPLGARPCVAYALQLDHHRGPLGGLFARGRPMLRDAVSAGFDVELDSGERVRISPGPCVIDLRAAAPVHVEDGRLADYLASIDPERSSTEDLDPFPHHRIRQLLLRPGQRVEVHGRLVPVADPRAAPSAYRAPAAAILVPHETPRLSLAATSIRSRSSA